MKITLIFPTKKEFIPLAALYLISNLENYGYAVDLRLMDNDRIKKTINDPANMDYILEILKHSNEIIAIGCMNNLLPYFLYAIRKLKKHSNKIIILGGPGPSEFAHEIVERFDEVDFVVKDRDPKILPLLLDSIQTNSLNIKGTVYKKNDEVLYFPSKKEYFENFTFPKQQNINYKRFNKFRLVTVEGCPYECTFCNSRTIISKNLKYRELNAVITEMNWALKHLDLNRDVPFVIVDEAFIVDRKRVIEFCSLLEKNKLDIHWRCYGRINHMDFELMKIMRNAGCKGIYYGIEAGNDNILKKIKKGFTIHQAIDTVLESKKYFKTVVTSFIWGYPFESFSDFSQTLLKKEFFHHHSISTQLKFLSPVKNSEIYNEYYHQLRFADENFQLAELYPLHPETSDFRKFAYENRDIFLGYNYFESPDLDKKLDVIKKMTRFD